MKYNILLVISISILLFGLNYGQRIYDKNFSFRKTVWNEKYDYIVAGGGTAGCVVAARLSENPKNSVLVLEAGISDDLVPATEVPLAMSGFLTPDSPLDWYFKSEPQKYACKSMVNNQSTWHAGKVLGGTSTVNGMNYVRGFHDFDLWENLGNEGWGHEDVLPYYKKSERNLNPELAQSIYHGDSGPWTISDSDPTPELTERFLQAGLELGYNVTDINGPSQLGFGRVQRNIFLGRRMSTSRAFLKPVVGRRNLKVKTLAYVTKILIAGSKARGVMYIDLTTQQPVFIKATKEVIVSAGALQSPQILMLSGIGPANHLRNMNIRVLKNLPVGDNLVTDLPFRINVSISNSVEKYSSFESLSEWVFRGTGHWSTSTIHSTAFFNPGGGTLDEMSPLFQIELSDVLQGNSGSPTGHEFQGFRKDIFDALHAGEVGKPGMVFLLVHLQPRSKGTVRLGSSNPFDDPLFTLNYLEDSKDVEEFIKGIRIVQNLVNTKPMQEVGAVYSAPPHPSCLDETFDTDAYWQCYVRHQSISGQHYTSSCMMGPGGVVDNKLKVYGYKNLRVADASVMPRAVTGNTMATTVMIAERVADFIKQGN